MTQARTLAQVAARELARAGSAIVFGVPGGGNNLELIGAAEAEGMRFVLTHTETAAACMAGAHSELTGIPTACVVTRGPGAASSVNGVAQAWLDRQPVLVLADAVPCEDKSRVSHQRLDQAALFAPVTKWSGVLGASDPSEVMQQALDTAVSPRPGPVHLDFDPTATQQRPRPAGAEASGSLAALNDALARCSKPVVVLGVGARRNSAAIREMLNGTNIPVLQTYKAKGLVADSSTNAAGLLTGATIEAPVLSAADAILAIGLDAVELIPGPWPYPAPLLSVSCWPEDSPYARATVEVVGPLDQLIPAIDRLHDGWEAGFARAERERGMESLCSGPSTGTGLAPWEVVRRLRAIAPPGSIATVDAGAHMLVAMPLWTTEHAGEVLVSSGLATMGFALPAAIAAALAKPDERTFALMGDGGLGMVLAELETAARLKLPLTVVVFNDSTLSLIKIKQEALGQGGHGAVAYRATDFAKVAQACGVPATRVSRGDELDEAARHSLHAVGPVLLDVLVDPTGYPYILDTIRGSRVTTRDLPPSEVPL
jgi:acetolactate synthase-1/2/3 large subunit